MWGNAKRAPCVVQDALSSVADRTAARPGRLYRFSKVMLVRLPSAVTSR